MQVQVKSLVQAYKERFISGDAMEAPRYSRLKRVLQRIGESILQDVPSELAACEICRKTECTEDEWIVCDNRIAHAKCLEGIEEGKS